MTVAVITALVVIAGMLGLVAWSVYGRVSASDARATSDVRVAMTEANLERVQFELDATKSALRASYARASLLEEAINAHLVSTPNPDLARNDVLQRTMRLYAAWAREDQDRVPPVTPTAVPEPRATETAGPVVSTRDTRVSVP